MTSASEPGKGVIDELQWKQLSPQLMALLEETARLLDTTYGYSVAYIASQFWAIWEQHVEPQHVNVNDIKQRFSGKFQNMRFVAESYRDFIHCYRALLNIINDLGIPNANQAGIIIGYIEWVVKRVSESIIVPFVDLSRRVGMAPATYYDSYGTFRSKWNVQLGNFEQIAKAFGSPRDMAQYYAPELGIIAQP